MKKWFIIIIVVLLGIYYFYPSKETPEPLLIENQRLQNINDSLMFKLDSINHETKQIDSIIVEVHKWYEKDFIDITNQPISDDVVFFTKYLSEINQRFVNSDNSDSIKAN